MSASLTDEMLIQQALAGQQAAFGTLVKRYEKYVFTLVLRWVKRREEADEVAQDVFLRSFRYLADFRGECKFTTWLYKIAYSTSLNHLRKKNPQIQSLDDALQPVHIEDTSSPNALQAMVTQDRNDTLRAAIEQLSSDDAAVITLFYLHEQSLEEICLITGFSMSNAKTKLCRARQRLKDIMHSRIGDLTI